MSVRAYRVVQAISEQSTFDLWNDQNLMDFLDSEILFSESLRSDGTGVVDVPIDVLEQAIRKADELKLDQDTIKQINLDVQFAKDTKDEYVSYYCF